MNDKKLYGNYMGIVVANNDPLKKGRVKIFIPQLSPNVYNNWNQTAQDKKFKFLGENVESPLNNIVEDLKDILPWAECASPLAGEVGTGRYNSYNKQATISDSSDYESSKPIKDFTPTKYSQNVDGTGEKPANILEKSEFALKDAFVSPSSSGANKANLYGQSYRPASYSNKAKGSFSIPPVGSHLWVFFIDGNPMYPVYFAASHGAEEWQGMYEFTDYPDSYENKGPGEELPQGSEHNVEIYRNKYLINQKGGTLEFGNTDNKESIKLTHYSGSSIQLTNPASIYLSTANEQHLILQDKFETIRGSDNFYVDGDKDSVIKGDVYRKIGSLDGAAMQGWKDLAQAIADAKQRFETQRVQDKQFFNSLKQEQKGSPAPCPVCKGSGKIKTLKNDPFKKVETSNVYFGKNPSALIIRRRQKVLNRDFGLTSEVGQYQYVDPKGVFPPGSPQEQQFPVTSQCPACFDPQTGRSTGKSKSSMDGNWSPDPIKQQLQQLIQEKSTALAKEEASLGLGGHEIIDITKHKIETIGVAMNDFGSIRVDSTGKMYNSSMKVNELGVYENKTPSPLIEYVHVDDLPGGNYSLNVCNRYTVQVGAGGISMKSFGPVQIGGTILNFAGEQVNIASGNEVNIDGGKRLTITSDIIYLKQRQMGQVMVDSSLGISKNLIVGGGAHIEGELTVNHITAPVEIQETEPTKVYGTTNNESQQIVGWVFAMGGPTPIPVFSCIPSWNRFPSENSVYTYPHSHHFRNAAMTLVKDNTELRKQGAKNNQIERNFAVSQSSNKKVQENTENKQYPNDIKPTISDSLG